MPAATDKQVQTYVNDRLRPRAEQFRALVLACADDRAAINDVYDACEPANQATWTDNRTDGPPRLLTAQDVLTFNTILYVLAKIVAGTATAQDVADFAANWATFQSACVRPVNLAQGQ
jgi:predicted TPR repeat methyltransferase